MSEQTFNMVPGRDNYTTRYVRGGRLFSYAHQMNAVLEHEPRTVLEIGPGPGMVTAALRAIGIEVTTVDIQPELKPDIVASVTDLPIENGSFDVTMCCQVLEHLPFDQFVPALQELGRVSRRAIVISLPDARPCYNFRIKLPGIRRVEIEINRSKRVAGDRIERSWSMSGHYWEIGYPIYDIHKVRKAFQVAGFFLARRWRPAEMPYHHFFELLIQAK